jgi:hypothetical protein
MQFNLLTNGRAKTKMETKRKGRLSKVNMQLLGTAASQHAANSGGPLH